MYKVTVIIFTLMLWVSSLMGQVNASDSAVAAFIPNFAYSYQFVGGNIAETFGDNSTIGGGFFVKTKKNLLLSADVNYLFGSNVKDEAQILDMVLNSQGYIIDGNGTYALYTLYERGYTINFRIGKIFDVISPNPNSGLMIMGGVGYLTHRLIIDNQHRTAPQISGDYAKGYDRLTSGINITEFIGYFFMGNDKLLNFYGGFEFMQGFTKSRRDYIFDLQKKDSESKIDLFYGIRIGWMIPAYKRAPDKYYYY